MLLQSTQFLLQRFGFDMGANVNAVVLQQARHLGGEGYVKVQLAQHMVLRQHFVGRAVEHAMAVAQHDNAVGFGGFFHEVGDHDNGHALGMQFLAHAHQAATPARVKHGGCFVEDEDARMHGKHAGDGNALLLAAGKGGGFTFARTGQPYLCQGFVHALA